MIVEVFASGLAACAIALLLTWWVRRMAIVRGMIDHPNFRSSHSRPTPRGGGLAIVVASSVSVLGLTMLRVVDMNLALALLGGGLPIAWIGFIDDRHSVSARLRLAMHAAAAIWAMYVLGGLPHLQVGYRLVDLGVAGYALGTIVIVWTLNLFNFMDGVDGIAASEGMFVTGFGAVIGVLASASLAVPAACFSVTAASLGFLIWNWPPAKIFMGDVGSGYLGYAIALLAIASARENPVMLYVWLILGGVFFADATVTLVRRLLRGEQVYVAHRSHGYQWLARRWNSHRRVTLAVMFVNVIWLLPCALMAALHPAWAVWIATAALAPVFVGATAAGAGRPE